MPVLARIFEAEGMSTIMVTNMPFWSEKVGVPRALAVEMPFGHILGKPGHTDLQMRILSQALDGLTTAPAPGTIIHSNERWPGTEDEARHAAHASQPPPISAEMGKYIGSFLRGMRRS